jgi:hypothetical protein
MRLVFDYVDFGFISKHSGFSLPISIPPLFRINFSSRGWTAGPLEDVVHRIQPRPTKSIKTDARVFIFVQANVDVRWFSFAGYCTVRSAPGYKIISDNLEGR